MVKHCWVLYAFNQLLSVLYMSSKVSYLRMENITKAMFSHKLVREYPNAFFYLVVHVL